MEMLDKAKEKTRKALNDWDTKKLNRTALQNELKLREYYLRNKEKKLQMVRDGIKEAQALRSAMIGETNKVKHCLLYTSDAADE